LTAKSNNNTTDEDLNQRLFKLNGGTISIATRNVNPLELTEEEQVERIINQAIDGARLDMFTPDSLDERTVKNVGSKTHRIHRPTNSGHGTPTPSAQPSGRKTKDSHRSEESSSSDYDSSDSEDIENDQDYKFKDTDDDFNRREKTAMKQLALKERARKKVAYVMWKKGQL